MNYKIDIEHNGRLYTITGDSKDLVFVKAKIFLNKHNINFTEDQIKNRIQNYVKPSKPKRLGLNDIIIGANAILRYTSGKAASNTEIKRRSEICKSCPMREKTTGCAPCGFGRRIANFINKIRAEKKAEVEIEATLRDSYCGVCSCSIPMMILTQYEDFYVEPDHKNNLRPDACWLKKTSINFTNE
jgi:hypothetical protein